MKHVIGNPLGESQRGNAPNAGNEQKLKLTICNLILISGYSLGESQRGNPTNA